MIKIVANGFPCKVNSESKQDKIDNFLNSEKLEAISTQTDCGVFKSITKM